LSNRFDNRLHRVNGV